MSALSCLSGGGRWEGRSCLISLMQCAGVLDHPAAVAIPILEMTCKDLTTAAYVLQATCSGARASNSGQDVDYLEHADALLVEVAALIKLFPIQAVEVFLTRCSEWASQPGMLTYACCTQVWPAAIIVDPAVVELTVFFF